MNRKPSLTAAVLVTLMVAIAPGLALATQSKPNIVFIMGDDIGMWNIGAYHRGLMAGRTPNIDKLAAEGAIFTDYKLPFVRRLRIGKFGRPTLLLSM